MNAVGILAGHGFGVAEQVGTPPGKVVVRVRTSKGWVYEKFDAANLEQSIAQWAGRHSP